MAVPTSGTITIHGLAKEKVYDNYSTTTMVQGPISLADLAEGGNTHGSTPSFDITNTASSSYPNDSTPHGMAEWYSYDHDAVWTANIITGVDWGTSSVTVPGTYDYYDYLSSFAQVSYKNPQNNTWYVQAQGTSGYFRSYSQTFNFYPDYNTTFNDDIALNATNSVKVTFDCDGFNSHTVTLYSTATYDFITSSVVYAYSNCGLTSTSTTGGTLQITVYTYLAQPATCWVEIQFGMVYSVNPQA